MSCMRCAKSRKPSHEHTKGKPQKDRRLTRKTRVLLSSIFFMADSVVSGHLITAYLSSFSRPTALQQRYRTDTGGSTG
jgi:hypothetical protein